jgi:ferric-dicitrate binding protein FerR (iron transport regulator)
MLPMPEQDYSQFSLSDFLEDQFFIRWVTRADRDSDAFWNAFMKRYPEKKAIILQASAVIKTYRSQDQFTNELRKNDVWARINTTLHHQPAVPAEKNMIPFYMKIAASVALMITCSAVFWFTMNSMNTVTTAHNEVTTITLPDHSIVTLNGNSTLRYTNDWDNESPREVWLDGEAYFNVKHINKDTLNIEPDHRFIVHSNKVNIEVLGTSFNVRNLHDQTNITLITGKVKVEPADKTSANAAQDLIMLPGDYVEFTSKKLVAKKKMQNPQQAAAWIRQEFVFNNAYLKDIIQKLKDDHGYTIDVKDPEVLTLKIEGEISVSSIQELLATVSSTLDLKVEQADKHIMISKK